MMRSRSRQESTSIRLEDCPSSNKKADFVGVESLKIRHGRQIQQFKTWANRREWDEFHHSHYDWWAFPINEPSSQGHSYTVYMEEIRLLQGDADFMDNFKAGLDLLALSWGWNLKESSRVQNPDPDQCW